MNVVKVSDSGDTVPVMELRALVSKIDLLEERFVTAGLGYKTRTTVEIIRFKANSALNGLLKTERAKHSVPQKLRVFSYILGDFLKRGNLIPADAAIFVEAIENTRLLLRMDAPAVPQAGYFIYAATKKVEGICGIKQMFG